MTDEKKGREVDARVAREVMGWRPRLFGDSPRLMKARPDLDPNGLDWWDAGSGGEVSNLWSPSTDIAAAWQVVEAMRERGYTVSLQEMQRGEWIAIFHNGQEMREDFAATPEAALCLAALAATRDAKGGDSE